MERVSDAKLALAGALFLCVCLLPALWDLDAVLRAIHLPGAASFGIKALSDPGLPPPEAGRPLAVAKTWYTGRADGFTEPATLARLYLALNLLFIVAYSSVLAVVLLRLRRSLLDTAAPASEEAFERRLARRDVEPDDAAAEHRRIRALTERYARVLTVACACVPILAFFDLGENALQGAAVNGCVKAGRADWCDSAVLGWSLYVVTALKWLVFAGVAVPAVLGLLELASFRRNHVRELARILVRVRAPLAVVAALSVVYLVKATPIADQAADLLRRWADSPHQAILGLLITIALTAVLLTCSRGLIKSVRPVASDDPVGPAYLWIAAAIVLVLGLVLVLVGPRGPGLLVPAALLATVAGLSTLAGPVADDPPPPAAGTFGAGTVPALLAAAPLVLLGLALQGAALGELAWARNGEYVLWLVTGLILQLAGWGTYWYFQGGGDPWRVPALLGSLVVAAVAAWTWADPWGVAGAVGGAGIVGVFAIAMTLLGSGLSWVAERYRPPAALRLLGFRRIPFLILLIAWGIGAAMIDKHGGFHDARLLSVARENEEPPGITLKELFVHWREQRGLPKAPHSGDDRPDPAVHATPLLIVASSGGGIRAAYWTAQTLDCLFGRHPTDHPCRGDARSEGPVIAASGVSGGSLGLTAWRGHVRTDNTQTWVDTLEEDTLTPSLAWGLFVDLPNSLLRSGQVADRAEILERSWEGEWLPDRSHGTAKLDADSPLAKGLFATGGEPPLLLLNGTAVESGCRLNLSALNADVDQRTPGIAVKDCLSVRGFEAGGLGPAGAKSAKETQAARTDWALGASVDLNRFMCDGRDIRLSTAALLSARFPYVSPSGRLDECGERPVSTYIVDGGYFDSSAAGTAAQLWTALEPIVERYNAASGQCVVPFAIQIDNGYDEPPGPDPGERPEESLVPLQTVLRGRDASEADARQALALAVNKPVGDIERVMSGAMEERRFAHLYPRAHPGTEAPLGWVLSDATQDDLVGQLRLESNAQVMSTIRDRWLRRNQLSCVRDPAPSRDDAAD